MNTITTLMEERMDYLELLQFLFSGREMSHVFHKFVQMLLRMAVGAVRVPRTGDSCDDQRHQNDVFDVTGAVLWRAEEHNIHGFNGDLLPVDWIFDTQHWRQVLRIVDRQPVTPKKNIHFRTIFQTKSNVKQHKL